MTGNRWLAASAAFLSCLLVVPSLFGQETSDSAHQLSVEARADEEQGRIDEAIKKYQAIIKLNSGLGPAYNNLGRLYFRQGSYSEAIKTLRAGLALDPRMATSHTLLGISLFETGDYKAARQQLTEAVGLNPKDSNAKLYLANSLMELEALEPAAKILEELEGNDPKNAQILYNLGQVQLKLASATLTKLQIVDPDSYLIDLLLGQTADAKQAYAEAIEHYMSAVAKAPNAKGLHYMLGRAFYLNGESPEALREFQREMEIDPYDYSASWEAGLVMLPDDPQGAFRLADKALQLKPNLFDALIVRGRALMAMNKPQEALRDFQQAAQLDPSEATVHFQLARAYRVMGLTREADAEDAIFAKMANTEHSPRGKKMAPPP